MRKIISYLIVFVIIPIIIVLYMIVNKDIHYGIIAFLIVFLACIPFFINFEYRRLPVQELVLISTLIAIAIVSRLAFAFLPGITPVSAIIIIVGLVFGKNFGFMVGALTAVLSNIYFSQGVWTVFQMFAWGLIGYIAGMIRDNRFFNNIYLVYIYGAISGVLFSLITDLSTLFFLNNQVKYLAVVVSSLPIMLTYIISNVIFLILLYRPINGILKRIKLKYGIYPQ